MPWSLDGKDFREYGTVTIEEGFSEPDLPDGLVYMGPDVEITADFPFQNEMQIYFRVPEPIGKDGKMICAFYWDSVDASWWEFVYPPWRLEFPESADQGLLCVSADYSGMWNWGEVLLGEVDVELLEPMADEYACLFVQANAMLWVEVGIYFVAEASLLGMELVQTAHPCP